TDQVAVAPSPITAASDSEFSDLSEELESELRPRPEFQRLLYPESQQSALTARDKQREQQRQQLLQGLWLPVGAPSSQDLQEGACLDDFTRTSPSLGAPGLEERIEERDDTPPPKPPVPPVAAICLTVEDPYFDASLSPTEEAAPASQWTANPVFSTPSLTPSLTLNDQTLELNSPQSGTVPTHSDEDVPPPLPMRTPESYVLGVASVDAEHSEPCDRLAVIIPPNAAAVALREMGGSPPSPVPPLPERTPESYELAIGQAPVEQALEVTPAVNLNRIGTSSEWSGNPLQAGVAAQNEMKPWTRSKSLKVKMTFTAPVTQPVLESKTTSNLPPPPPPADLLTPPLSPQASGSLTPPLPDRTPESFILATEEGLVPPGRENAAPCLQPSQTTEPSPRIGISSEWAGTSQSKKFLDVVMNRSKSVRAKSSRQEPLTAFQQLAPPPVVVAGGGSAEVEQHGVNHRPTPSTETSDNKSSGKGMSRTKSLKFFRHKVKPKTAPPPAPTQSGSPPPSNGASTSLFKFGFGNRFGKPKGPRSHPETWV
ncbi:uncharacterized protein, partial [Centroberyx affinis]|uniref:uncharacterized protein n=1 Tax=Centroberyx affinis TaxID=166261 RepID=UPI003A5BBCE1